jgi:hypothetical protein
MALRGAKGRAEKPLHDSRKPAGKSGFCGLQVAELPTEIRSRYCLAGRPSAPYYLGDSRAQFIFSLCRSRGVTRSRRRLGIGRSAFQLHQQVHWIVDRYRSRNRTNLSCPDTPGRSYTRHVPDVYADRYMDLQRRYNHGSSQWNHCIAYYRCRWTHDDWRLLHTQARRSCPNRCRCADSTSQSTAG